MKIFDKIKNYNAKSSKPMNKRDVIIFVVFVIGTISLVGYEKIFIEPTLQQDTPKYQINDSKNTIDLSDLRYCDQNGNCDMKLIDKLNKTR